MSGNWLWDLRLLDLLLVLFVLVVVVVSTIYVLSWFSLGKGVTRRLPILRVLRRTRGDVLAVAGAVAVVLGPYIAYGTVRNQMLMSAEASSNETANLFVEWEKADPYIRCLYTWDLHIDHERCLRQITSSGAKLTEVMLYIEEVFFFMDKSKREARNYRSPYFTDIDYWRRDVEEDPTGLFSMYILNTYGVEGVPNFEELTGVCIPDICGRYEQAQLALRQNGFRRRNLLLCQNVNMRAYLNWRCQVWRSSRGSG